MGTYINTGNSGFQRARNGEYVDKSALISVINSTLNTEHCMSCVSRCRRFGKSMAAKMLFAYYDQSCDSRHLFEDLKITGDASFEQHLNKILLELKYDNSANTAISQIHKKEYTGKVAQYDGQVILVGINYDPKTKRHECRIEKVTNLLKK